MFTDNQTIDNMHRQSSRIISNSDAIDCIVNTNDLAFEHDLINQEYDQQRSSSDSRRNQTSKRTNGNSIDRSTRHSPPSVTRKRQSSPQSISLLSTRSQHHYYPSQRHHRVSGSPSPPPPPQTSSRHHRPSRPVTSVKRPHSKSRSPYERRSSTHRSYRESSKKRISDNEELPSTPSTKKQTISTKPILKQDMGDLSLVSEDESIKPYDIRSNSSTINQSPSNNKLHSTPSLPILQPNSNESLLEMSTIPRDGELSLFAKSALSTTNTSSILTTPTLPINDLIQTIDLMNKYKTMQPTPSDVIQMEAFSKEILLVIQKQIELHKKELDYREREMKLREYELAEREKRFNERLNDPSSLTSVISEPLVVVKSAIIEEKPQPKSEIIIDQITKNVSQQESVEQSIPSTVDASQVDLVNKNGSGLPPLTRKNREKSRFSELIINPSIFPSQPNPVVNLYSDDHDDNQSSSSSINPIHSFKKTIASKILVPSESTKSIVDTDLKVTSSNLCRKVEIQSEPIHKPKTSKGSSHDLRLTLSKNRTKQQNNDDNTTTNSNPILIDDEQIVTIDKAISSKINSIKEDKQQSHDYHQQRSVTSTSIETIIDDTNDKRDHHRQQLRTNSSRQQQYSGQNSSSSITVSNERSYTHGSASQQLSKYGSNQKRHDNEDLRSRLYEHKPPKSSSSSRSTNRDNY